ncbi:MAG: PhoH family protein [Bacillota bacterium]|nr:PhoH family protein [Bacillota bacterium]
MTEYTIELESNELAALICGQQDQYLRQIEAKLQRHDAGLKLLARGDRISINGPEELQEQAIRVISHLQQLAASGADINTLSVSYALSLRDEDKTDVAKLLTQSFFTTPKGRSVKPKTFGQWLYLNAIDHFDLVFGIGPAGTGKTFLAVLKAVAALKQRRVDKLVLVRPAVEAGEKLGFLPGDLQEKVNPYLRPVYDALDEAMGVEPARKALDRGIIEVAPLAYMRGRTLDNAFIILDEAQNTTPQQMKMFLTRIGMGSRAVVTGDTSQIDLPEKQLSGLVDAEHRLRRVQGLQFCHLTRVDVVRHPLVQRIIDAYDKKEEQEEQEDE